MEGAEAAGEVEAAALELDEVGDELGGGLPAAGGHRRHPGQQRVVGEGCEIGDQHETIDNIAVGQVGTDRENKSSVICKKNWC